MAACLTARSHPGTNAGLQQTAVSSIAYKEALIFRRSSWTETNPQSLPRTSVARDTTMSYGMINSSSLRVQATMPLPAANFIPPLPE